MGKTQKDPDAANKEEKARQKQMEAVAKHLRSKVPCKSAVIKGRKVEYFVSCKAVDCLMESKWTKMPEVDDHITPYFAARTDAAKYLVLMLQRKFFLRANKVEVKPKGEDSKEAPPREKKAGKEGEGRRKKVTDSPRAKKQQEKESSEEEGKKKKKKFRLELHPQQVFRDSDDVYFWQYDPPSYSSYIIGFGVVIGAIAVTLQPLWPDSTRVGLWYLSMLLFGVIGTLVAVIVVRWFLFGFLLIITVGKVNFWILPNLDDDKADFFGSFTPLYSIEVKSQKEHSKKKRTKVEKTESAEIPLEDAAKEDQEEKQDTEQVDNGSPEECQDS